ncbi:MAG: 16S rRNA (cytidine(1402)-2'-O)-methyltransferase [Gammaproteobacteria bacterium]|nr:MAG: 16S rRNA (cytidine(1402)-2'-O)-methyltransferase [Gammaproteobacteria bacterium]
MPPLEAALYVVATPIGNLADLGARARDVLAGADWLAVEDTRRTGQLLTSLGLSKRMRSLHEHNEAARVPELLGRLAAGESVALLSDAGTPLVSDPGYRLVSAAAAEGLPVIPVPGPCAAIAALSVAGLPTDSFYFAGFLPARAAARRRRLQALAGERATLVFYETARRIDASLAALADEFGGDRPAVLCRELSKRHETIYRGSLASLPALLAADPGGHRGEMTLVVGGAPAAAAAEAELRRVFGILAGELPPARAASLAARIAGGRRADAYRLAGLQDED